MKQLVLLLILTLGLVACKAKNPATTEVTKKTETDEMRLFKSILNGSWYQALYIDSIKKTKSPFRSGNALAPIVELDIRTGKTDSDSILVNAPNIHEGGTSFMLYFKPGLTPTTFPVNFREYEKPDDFYELGYRVSAVDTVLILYKYNKEKKIIDKTSYLKAPENPDGPLQYMVNKTLFAGSYNAEDNTGRKSIIQFLSNGKVMGLPGFQKYYVLTDFVAGPEVAVDEVCFDIQTKNQYCYGFAIDKDSIRLYDVIENDDNSRFGALKFKLIRKK